MRSQAPYDAVAPSFDRHRALPDGVPDAIRAAVLGVVDAAPRPRLLDLGAGTGRIGWAFVAADDDYVGVDLSLGMLCEFSGRIRTDGRPFLLVQADGRHLPFRDASFDAVLQIHLLGAAQNWRELTAESRRVLRSTGALVIGHTLTPADGLDYHMKWRLASLLSQLGVSSYHLSSRADGQRWFDAIGPCHVRLVATSWQAERTPRAFLNRQRTGARFSALPDSIKDEALRRLAAWATDSFGGLDIVSRERHEFELRVFRFQ